MLTSVPEEIRIFGVVTRAYSSLVRISKGNPSGSNRMKQNLPPLVFVLALMLLPGAFAALSNQGNSTQITNLSALNSDFYVEPNNFIILRSASKTLDLHVNFEEGENSYGLSHTVETNGTEFSEEEDWIYYPPKIDAESWQNKSIPIILKVPDEWEYQDYLITLNLVYQRDIKDTATFLMKVRSEASLMALEEGEIEGGVFNDVFNYFILATVAALVIIIYLSYKKYV